MHRTLHERLLCQKCLSPQAHLPTYPRSQQPQYPHLPE